jgi:hyperosmotically inducible protein
MMNSDSTHKIVVGIALAAVFGVGVSVFVIRFQHEIEAARNAPAPALAAPADQNATDATTPAQNAAVPPSTPPAVAPAPVDPTASNSATDGVGNPPSDESNPAKSKPSDRADRHSARARSSGDTGGTRVASASNSNPRPAQQSASSSSDSVTSNNALAPAPSSGETTASAPGGAIADSRQAPAQTGQEAAISDAAGAGATNVEPAAADSQITASVKSEIATAAPNSDVDVTTTNGAVALAGSVSSQDAVDQVRQAAQRVTGVKHVDASGLTVSNQ